MAEAIVRLGSVSRPRPLSYGEITEMILRATEGLWIRPPFVRRLLAKVPGLLESRAVAREFARPRVAPADFRRHELDERTRRLILSKAAILVETPGGVRPAYTLAELGRLAPRPLGRFQVRRLILAADGGRELLEARSNSRRRPAA